MSNTDVTVTMGTTFPTGDPMPNVDPADIYTMGLTGDDLELAANDPIELVTTPAQQSFDPEKMIREIGKFNPKFANTLWYKLKNQPGTIKVVDGEKYIVSPKGSWVKERN